MTNATASQQPETACNNRAQGRGIFGVLEDLIHAWRSRRDAEHLASLNNYLLKDIGITRNDIDAVVRQARYPF